MVLASLSEFSQKHSPFKVWNAIGLSAILAGVAVWFLNPTAWFDVAIFASGIIPAWILGIVVLAKLLKNDNFSESLFAYRAMAESQPKLFLLLFLSFLGLVGFCISPAFLGEDLLLSHASNHAPWFALPITVAFVINGIAATRVFQRLCMGSPTELNIMTEELEIKVALSIKTPYGLINYARASGSEFSGNRMLAQQRILPVIKLQLLVNFSKMRLQNFRCAEKIFTDYRKKLGWTGCCIRVDNGVMVMLDPLHQAFISNTE
jgi:hypothetical protein